MRYLLIILLALSMTSFSYAADIEEQIELTTYYPAPYGEYDTLITETLIAGGNAFPADSGTSGQSLITDGAGGLTWQSIGGDRIYSVGKENIISTSSDVWVNVPDMSITRDFTSTQITVNFFGSTAQMTGSGGADACFLRILVDGVEKANSTEVTGYAHTETIAWAGAITPGSHTITVQWHVLAAGKTFGINGSRF